MPRAASADERAQSVQGLAPGLSPGLMGVAVPPQAHYFSRLSSWSLSVGFVLATWGGLLRLRLFEELLSLLLSGLDLCCKARAVLGTCQHLEGACPQGAGIQPLSFLLFSPEWSQRKDRSCRDIPGCIFSVPT